MGYFAFNIYCIVWMSLGGFVGIRRVIWVDLLSLKCRCEQYFYRDYVEGGREGMLLSEDQVVGAVGFFYFRGYYLFDRACRFDFIRRLVSLYWKFVVFLLMFCWGVVFTNRSFWSKSKQRIWSSLRFSFRISSFSFLVFFK